MIRKKPKMILLGASGVGKTVFLHRYMTGTYEIAHANTAVEYEFCSILVNNQKVTFHVWDTAGQEVFESLNIQYYRNTAVAILMFGVDDIESFVYLNRCYRVFREEIGEDAKVLLFVVGNKTDIKREVTDKQGMNFAKSIGGFYCECSSLTGEGVREVFAKIGQEYGKANPKILEKTETLEKTCSSQLSYSSQLSQESDTITLTKQTPSYGRTVIINCFTC